MPKIVRIPKVLDDFPEKCYVGIPTSINTMFVQKSNPLLTLAITDLTLEDFKILDAYLARINSHDLDKRAVRLEKGELEKLLGVVKINKPDLKKRLMRLSQSVPVDDPDNPKGFKVVSLFEEIDAYLDDDGLWQITLKCTQSARKYFYNIEKLGYLKYRLKNVINLTSRYSYFLYLYLEANRFLGFWKIDLDTLKIGLRCMAETYNQYKRFNDLVLKKCHKELTEKTTMHFSYKPIKHGRKVVAIEFTILDDNALSAPEIDPDQVSVFDALPVPMNEGLIEDYVEQYGSEELAILASGVQYEFTREQMWELRTLLPEIDILPDKNFDGLDAINWGRMNYLAQVYAKLNRVCEEKRNTKEPIKNRFAYFRAMVDKDRGDRE